LINSRDHIPRNLNKEKGVARMLIGGCLTKRFPRKDIDVIINYTSNLPIWFKDFEVDWWIYDSELKYAWNTHGIKIHGGKKFEQRVQNKTPGLFLPPYKNINPELLRLFPSQNLKGGEEK